MVTVICVSDSTVKLARVERGWPKTGDCWNMTKNVPVKPAPVIVMVPPPPTGPEVGEIPVIVIKC